MPTFLGFQLQPGDRLELRTLGQAALYVLRSGQGDQRAPLAGKQLALVTYLACTDARSGSRTLLVDLLWADPDLENPAEAFRRTLYEIRRKLGEDVLGEHGSDRVTLTIPIETDRDALLEAFRRDDLEQVVRLYAGEFLPRLTVPGGKNLDDWIEAERVNLRRIFCQSARELARRYVSLARLDDAVEMAVRARDEDRWDEDNWRALLECLIGAGKLVRAAFETDALERHLAGAGPKAQKATRDLIAAVRGAAAANAAARVDPLPKLTAELVGRETELSTIADEWKLISSGRSGFRHIQIVGGAGIGKTRLLADALAQMHARRASVVRVAASFGLRDIPNAFAAEFVTTLADLPGAAAVPTWSADALVALSSALSTHYRGARPDPAIGDEALRRRAEALCELLKAIADDTPVAVMLDDLHWCDAISLRMLRAALTKLRHERAPVLLVSATRASTDDLCEATSAREITLEPLVETEIRELVSSIASLPAESWADSLPIALRKATGGSPLLLLEKLELLRERSILIPTPNGWVAPEPSLLSSELREGSALRQRLERLPRGDQRVLLLLAVGGVPLSSAQLRTTVCSSTTANATTEFDASLAALQHRGLVVRDGDDWRVAHDEHARAVLDMSSTQDVQSSAATVGRAIAAEVGSDARRLQQAAPLLVAGSDSTTLNSVFERFVRRLRLDGDRRPDRMLARDLLGAAATAEREIELIRSLPWLVRMRLVSAPRIAAAAAVAIIAPLMLSATVAMMARAEPPPDAVLVAERVAADGSMLELFDVPLDASRWAGIGVIDVNVSRRPRWRFAKEIRWRDLRPDGRGWTGSTAVADSGVLDIVDVRLDGRERRLTFERGDDYGVSWAPDNSRFVFATMRWARRARYDLAIYDTLSATAHQITRGDEIDSSPVWSPDGSRIAFSRQYVPGNNHALCIIDANGENLRCLPPEAGSITPETWTDSRHVLIIRFKGNRSELARINVDSGAEDFSDPSGGGGMVSPDGRWVVCQCPRRGYPPRSWIVYPLERPNEFKLLRVPGSDSATIQYNWAPTTPRHAFLAEMRILAGPGSPVLGASYQLRSAGVDSSGRAVELGVVRWSSLDTSVATISSAGLLTPRRSGRVSIEASAGGWRRTRRELSIGNRESQVLFDERWAEGLTREWVPFGEPKPRVVTSERFGRAFFNNGDEAFWSGAYTSQSFETRGGVWVEAEISAPITREEWQAQVLTLFSVTDSVAWNAWDHVHGDAPGGTSRHRFEFSYDHGLGGFDVALSTLGRYFPAPAVFRDGRAFRVLMQIFPDGRCGVAIDGKPLAMSSPGFFEPVVKVMLAGRSVDTWMLVGPLRVVSGISPHIDWETAVDAPGVGGC